MKERTNAKTDSPATGETGVVELTPDMAVVDPSQIKIIELTDALDSPDASPPTQPQAPPAVELTESVTDMDAAVTPAAEPDMIKEEALESVEPAAHSDAAATPADGPDKIEKEVDAAFDKAQIETAARARSKAEQDQLLDQLTNLTDMVDDAVRDSSDASAEDAEPAPDNGGAPPSRGSSDRDDPSPMDTPDVDADQLARDAAMIDAAMAAEPEDDAVGSTDRVDPAEPDVEIPLGPETLETELDDEDLLAMIDIADPRTSHGESSANHTAAEADDIIELTDIVDPAELAQSAAPVEPVDAPDEEIIELSDIVDPAKLQQRGALDEALIELTDIVDPETVREALPDARPGGTTGAVDDDIIELTDIVDPADLEPSAVFARSAPTDEDEPIIRLADVLDDPAREDRPAKDDDPLR